MYQRGQILPNRCPVRRWDGAQTFGQTSFPVMILDVPTLKRMWRRSQADGAPQCGRGSPHRRRRREKKELTLLGVRGSSLPGCLRTRTAGVPLLVCVNWKLSFQASGWREMAAVLGLSSRLRGSSFLGLQLANC